MKGIYRVVAGFFLINPLLLANADQTDPVPDFYSKNAIKANAEHDAWKFDFQDDYFAPIRNSDNNYSFGFSAIQGGKAAKKSYMSIEPAVNWIDTLWGLKAKATDQSNAVGFYGFTPTDKASTGPIYNDRPYASLLYLNSSHFRVNENQREAIYSSFTVGVLGLAVFGDIQNLIHDAIGNDRAQGWGNQISAGGEPTGRYAIAYQQSLLPLSDVFELKHSIAGSLGYITQANWSLSLRAGKIDTPWWTDHPELDIFGESSGFSAPIVGANENYFSMGIQGIGRLYNALVQGQFRESKVSYDFNETRNFMMGGWLAYTLSFKPGIRVRYFARFQTSELRTGLANRTFYWAGFSFTQAF